MGMTFVTSKAAVLNVSCSYKISEILNFVMINFVLTFSPILSETDSYISELGHIQCCK